MLNEYKKLIPTKKEMKLQIYINQLINDLYSNKKIEVDSKKLLELLSYLTSNENISTQMKTATEYQNRKIADILHIKEVEYLKRKIKYLKENSILKQKIKDKMEEYRELVDDFEKTDNTERFKKTNSINYYKLEALQELLQEEDTKNGDRKNEIYYYKKQ